MRRILIKNINHSLTFEDFDSADIRSLKGLVEADVGFSDFDLITTNDFLVGFSFLLPIDDRFRKSDFLCNTINSIQEGLEVRLMVDPTITNIKVIDAQIVGASVFLDQNLNLAALLLPIPDDVGFKLLKKGLNTITD